MSSLKKPSISPQKQEISKLSPTVPKHKRRKRDDVMNRNYTCGCGKSYLSYPALYTHLKQKHDGKQPEGTKLPSSMRGRKPRKELSQGLSTKEERNEQMNNNNIEEKPDEVLDLLSQMSSFLKKEHATPIKFLLEDDEPTIDVLNDFPTSFFKNNSDFFVIYKYLEQLKADPFCFDTEIDQTVGLKPLNINKIFAVFLYKIAGYVNKNTFCELTILMAVIRKTLNTLGWKIKENHNNNNSNSAINEEFCENNTGDCVLQFANELITSFLPMFLQENLNENSDNFVLLGNSEEKVKYTIYLTQYFGNWLFNNHYTNLKLDINYE